MQEITISLCDVSEKMFPVLLTDLFGKFFARCAEVAEKPPFFCPVGKKRDRAGDFPILTVVSQCIIVGRMELIALPALVAGGCHSDRQIFSVAAK